MPWHFTAFHPDYRMLDRPATPPATLVRARDIAVGYGLRYVYTGNVHDPVRGSTYCHSCGTQVIGRDWYQLSTWKLTADGHCRICGAICAGVFEGATWSLGRTPLTGPSGRVRVARGRTCTDDARRR